MPQRQTLQSLDERRMCEHELRAARVDRVLQRCAAVCSVQRDEHCAEIVDREPRAHERWPVRQPRYDAIAGTNTERLQRRSLRTHVLAAFTPRPFRSVLEQRNAPLRHTCGTIVENGLEDAVLAPWHARIEPRRMHGLRRGHGRTLYAAAALSGHSICPGIHAAWKPIGTRPGSATRAIGPLPMRCASRIQASE